MTIRNIVKVALLGCVAVGLSASPGRAAQTAQASQGIPPAKRPAGLCACAG